jgi:integrase
MSVKSVNKHIARLGSLLKYCNDIGMIVNNPASGLKLSEKQRADQERNVYAPEDIKKIVCGLPMSVSCPERYWIPLIGLYSGLRLNEISQLYVEDVIMLDGCWCFNINADKNKRLKNAASARVIPVHPKLIELGLIQYCENIHKAGHPRLWMNLEWADISGYTNSICKWYQRFNRQHVTEDPKKVFHSMRHTVADTLKQKGVPEVVIAEVLGHTHTSITSGRYGKRYQPKILLDALMQLDYDVDIQPWGFAAG